VVYIGTDGGETVLMQKTIGKAGSGGGGFEDKYTIIHRVNWQTFLDDVNASSGGISLGRDIVYVDNGEYWASYNSMYMLKSDAATNPSIQTYTASHPNSGLLKIDLSKKIYNTSDIEIPGGTWKSPYPTIGSLYEYSGALYMDIITASGPDNPDRNPDNVDHWAKIATKK